MSLDGTFLSCIVNEMLSAGLIGGRIDKIYQPSREEVILSIRSAGKHNKLLISANSMSARVGMTERAAENPSAPPMFCMLLRKHLSGGKLLAITQDGLERIINFDFECMNEIGDMVINRLTAEIMGRHSNIILMTEKDGVYRVIDSIKRITDDVSSVRRILPNIVYETPPRDLSRINFLTCTDDELINAVKSGTGKRLSKHLTACLEGVSPVFARECAYYSCRDTDAAVCDMTSDNFDRLLFFIKKAREYVRDGEGFTILRDLQGGYKDFCFMPIEQYGTQMLVSKASGANALLDIFYGSKAENERMKQRSKDLLKMLMNTYDRISRKLELQKSELGECGEREVFRVRGDIVSANIYKMHKGMTELTAEDYSTGETVTVPLDARLTPAQNAQKYYAEYKKLEKAEKMLTKLIADGENELIYIDSVFDAASRATSNAEISEIKQELAANGYIHAPSGSKKTQIKPKPPMHFVSDDGYDIYIGRNNIQNDKLTVKTAEPDDMWLHTKNIAGSHVIIKAKNGEISDNAILQAASLAAYCSKAQNSTKVPVDYTRIRFVKKPNGAKPGMVIFSNNFTVLVDPDEELFARVEA